MKNLNEFIEYVNNALTGGMKNDLKTFYNNILPKDRQLTVDESLELINKCPKLFSVLLNINPDNILVNNSTIYSAFKIMTEDRETENNDFNEEKIVEERDKVYFSNLDPDFFKTNTKDIDSLKLHLAEIGPIPILTKEQTKDLFKRYKNGDEAARNDIWIHNLKLSASMAKKYVGRGIPIMDLISQGHLGLLRAIEKYDYRLGYNFSTYATWWVKQAMTRYIADHSFSVRIPVHVHESVNKIKNYINAYIAANNCEPTKEEILNATSVKPQAYDLFNYIVSNGFVLSLDKPVSSDGIDDGETSFGDFIASDEEPFDEKVTNKITMTDFDYALDSCALTPREMKVIKMRYGFEDGNTHTLEEVGRELGVTRERIRQIEVRALKKLRSGKNREKMRQFRSDYGTKEEINLWNHSLR